MSPLSLQYTTWLTNLAVQFPDSGQEKPQSADAGLGFIEMIEFTCVCCDGDPGASDQCR
jgi:hypothetical protein